MQSDDGLESYVKGRINPLIDDHEGLRSRRGLRTVDDSLHFKRFRGMTVEFLPFGQRTILNKSVRWVVADEIDNYQWLGAVKPVLDVRRQVAQAMGHPTMLLALSHPDMARGLDPAKDWTAGITAIYADSTREVWYWRCPRCQAVSSPHPLAERVMYLDYPSEPDVPLDVVEAEACLRCPSCRGAILDHEREGMNLEAFNAPWGGWIGEGQEIDEGGTVRGELVKRDTAGFWIVGTMSPFVLGGLGGLAREYVRALRSYEISGDDNELRQVVVKQHGLPYSRPKVQGTVEAQDLVDRAEHDLKLGLVPNGVRFLVMAVDVQIWGFEYLVRGFGENGESWIVDHGRLAKDPETDRPIDPATSPEAWDLLLPLYLKAYPLADGSGRGMKVRALGFDSHGAAGVTAQAYAAWKRWKKVRLARLFGQMGGRDVWSIIPLGGASGLRAKKLTVVYPDTARAAGRVARGEVPVGMFNPNLFKADLAGQLKRAEPGDWFVHFPAALKSKAPPHTFFEQLVAEHEVGGRWVKKDQNAKNEGLDLMVMSHVVAHLHGLSRIVWEKAQPWCAPWDRNPLVVALAEGVAEPAGPSEAAPAAGTNAVRPAAAEEAGATAPPKKRSLASRLA
jgi:phage terminase large subunit GpA-like protein